MSKVFTQSQAIDFIEKAFGSGRLSNQGQNISVVCPMCKSFKEQSYNKQKLVIRTDNFLVHCWICGYKNRNLLNLIKRYHTNLIHEYKNNFLNAEDLTQIRQDEKLTNKQVMLPDGFQLLVRTNNRDSYAVSAKKYLKSRGVNSVHDLWYWKFGITSDYESGCKYRIIIPSYNDFGNLNYWTARTWIKKVGRYGHKYKNPDVERTQVIFNENNIDWHEELTLVEGPFDLIKCNENATAVLGSELSGNYKLFQKILKHKTPVLLAFDNEPKAQKKQMRIANTLNEFDISVRILEMPTEGLDVGELTSNEFNVLRKNANIYSEEYSLRRKIKSII